MSTLVTTALRHNASASNNMVLDSSGRVGIGTATPGFELHVAAAGNPNLLAENTTSGVRAFFGTSGAGVAQFGSTNAGVRFLSNNLEVGRFDTSNNFQFNSGYGSVATAFGCRAWVNFNGTGTIAIRASGNITSITDQGVGDYRLNFTNAMPDLNYCTVCTKQNTTTNADTVGADDFSNRAVGSVRVVSVESNILADSFNYNCAVFR